MKNMNLVRIDLAVKAIVDGTASVADVIAAARAARIETWDGYTPSAPMGALELDAFWAVSAALKTPARPLTEAEKNAVWEARIKTEAEQERLDKL